MVFKGVLIFDSLRSDGRIDVMGKSVDRLP